MLGSRKRKTRLVFAYVVTLGISAVVVLLVSRREGTLPDRSGVVYR
jgi:uncharacterized membrane protein